MMSLEHGMAYSTVSELTIPEVPTTLRLASCSRDLWKC